MKKMGKVSKYYAGKILGLYLDMDMKKPSLIKTSLTGSLINGVSYDKMDIDWTTEKATIRLGTPEGGYHDFESDCHTGHMCLVDKSGNKVRLEDIFGTSVKVWNALWNTMKELWFNGPSDFGLLYAHELKMLD